MYICRKNANFAGNLRYYLSMKRFLSLAIVLLLTLFLSAQQPKYIFYIIGDGLGVNQVTAAEMYMAELQGRIGAEKLLMTQFPYTGNLRNFSLSNGITDSSAAGTCLASGYRTNNRYEGLTAEGEPAISITDSLKQKGWAIGIATSVSIDHATPAAFYAHVADRNDYYYIGQQLVQSNYDFFGGGTFYQPNNVDNIDDPNLYDLAEQEGYVFARGFDDFLTKQDAPKMILIQPGEGVNRDAPGGGILPRRFEREENSLTLAQLVEAGIMSLSRNDNFFFMIEAGAIDWAGHLNDGAAAIDDVIEMDKAVQVAYDFYVNHPDETLIVITADHETGGMALGNSNYTLNLQILQNQKVYSSTLSEHIKNLRDRYGKKLKWEQVRQVLTEDLGFYATVEINKEEDASLRRQFALMQKGKDKSLKTLYSEISQLTRVAVGLLNKKARLGWTSHTHTASPVPIFAIGVGAEYFAGWHDITEMAPMLHRLAMGEWE